MKRADHEVIFLIKRTPHVTTRTMSSETTVAVIGAGEHNLPFASVRIKQ